MIAEIKPEIVTIKPEIDAINVTNSLIVEGKKLGFESSDGVWSLKISCSIRFNGSVAKNLAFLQNQKKPSQLGKLIIFIRKKMIHKGENYNVKMQKYYFCNGTVSFVAYYAYKFISGNSAITSSMRVIAAAIAGWISLTMGALCAGFELGIQPIIEHTAKRFLF